MRAALISVLSILLHQATSTFGWSSYINHQISHPTDCLDVPGWHLIVGYTARTSWLF